MTVFNLHVRIPKGPTGQDVLFPHLAELGLTVNELRRAVEAGVKDRRPTLSAPV